MTLKHALRQKNRPVQAGFTLIEILLVIVIILMLAGALVVFVLPQQEGAEKNTTKLMLNQVSTALDTYRLNLAIIRASRRAAWTRSRRSPLSKTSGSAKNGKALISSP